MEILAQQMNHERYPRTWAVLEQGLSQGVAPSLVGGIFNRADPGRMALAAVGKGTQTDTVFDLASVSKVIATSLLAARLVDRGWLSWDLPVQAVLPEYRFADVQLKHLLTHTAGYIAWKPLWQELRDHFKSRAIESVSIEERQREMRRLVLALSPERAPGSSRVYSDFSMLLAGFVLEEVMQMPLDKAVTRAVWDPMGVTGLYYRRVNCNAEQGRVAGIPPTEVDLLRGGLLQGQVHDENCWTMGGYGGHAGVFGRAQDVLGVAAYLLCTRFLSVQTQQESWSQGYGWDQPSGESPSSGQYFSKQSVGHLGFTGTSLWIDPEAGVAVALLTNRVNPTRDNLLIREFRPKFHDAIRTDFSELTRSI